MLCRRSLVVVFVVVAQSEKVDRFVDLRVSTERTDSRSGAFLCTKTPRGAGALRARMVTKRREGQEEQT